MPTTGPKVFMGTDDGMKCHLFYQLLGGRVNHVAAVFDIQQRACRFATVP